MEWLLIIVCSFVHILLKITQLLFWVISLLHSSVFLLLLINAREWLKIFPIGFSFSLMTFAEKLHFSVYNLWLIWLNRFEWLCDRVARSLTPGYILFYSLPYFFSNLLKNCGKSSWIFSLHFSSLHTLTYIYIYIYIIFSGMRRNVSLRWAVKIQAFQLLFYKFFNYIYYIWFLLHIYIYIFLL